MKRFSTTIVSLYNLTAFFPLKCWFHCCEERTVLTCSEQETSQHQEKNGAFFWNLWVNVLLKFLNFSDVPIWPRDLSTNTLGIWTSWRGLFPSFRACDRLRICPLSTDICFSNIDLYQPRSVCKKKKILSKILDLKEKANLPWTVSECHHRGPGQSSYHWLSGATGP